jgi:molecular chaperone GrpE
MSPEDTDIGPDAENTVMSDSAEAQDLAPMTPDEIDALLDECDDRSRRCIEQLLSECAEAAESRQRALADFKNFQRRSTENELRMNLIASSSVLRAVLPVLDQLDMALQQDTAQVSSENILQGVQIVREEMDKVLLEQGVDRIEPEVGQEFDPTRHEAMLKQEVEGVESGHVTSLLQVGYCKSDQILRAAKVAVAP